MPNIENPILTTTDNGCVGLEIQQIAGERSTYYISLTCENDQGDFAWAHLDPDQAEFLARELRAIAKLARKTNIAQWKRKVVR